MTLEERVRATLARRAGQVELSSDAWDRIRARTEGAPAPPRRVAALALTTAAVALALAATWLLRPGPGPEVPVLTDDGSATTATVDGQTTTTAPATTTTDPTTTTTDPAIDGDQPVVVTTIDGGPWRLVVGRRDGGACPQVHLPGEPFDPTFCGAYEVELDRQAVALGFGGADETTSGPSFGYGMVRPDIERIRLELADGGVIEAPTIGHSNFPGMRFFAVTLADEPGFNGVEEVVALGPAGEEVARIDTSGRDDI